VLTNVLTDCFGNMDTTFAAVAIPAGQSTRDSAYFLQLGCDDIGCSVPFHTQVLGCVKKLVNASQETGKEKCSDYTYTNPQGPPPGPCPTALAVKTPRFPTINYTPAGPVDTLTSGSQLTGPMTNDIEAQAADICAGEATAWISSLQRGLDTIHATSDTIQALRNALVSICSAGGDVNHPMGASTLPPGASGPYNNFGAAIKGILLGGGNFTALLNPWLIDGPNP